MIDACEPLDCNIIFCGWHVLLHFYISLYFVCFIKRCHFELCIFILREVYNDIWLTLVGLPESNGYIYIEANGGLNQQRTSVFSFHLRAFITIITLYSLRCNPVCWFHSYCFLKNCFADLQCSCCCRFSECNSCNPKLPLSQYLEGSQVLLPLLLTFMCPFIISVFLSLHPWVSFWMLNLSSPPK